MFESKELRKGTRFPRVYCRQQFEIVLFLCIHLARILCLSETMHLCLLQG